MIMNEEFNYCHVSERTDVGCVRAANEDSMINFTCQNGLVAAVCDGMGGHVGGAVASQTAVNAIKSFLSAQYFQNPFDAIVAAIDNANRAILQTAAARPELQGMGSTCVMVIVRGGMVYYGSVGDSRIYLVRNHTIKQLTRDQSYVQMLVDAGEITPEQAEHHPQKNVITNALGLADMRPATVAAAPIRPEAGDCFLLCSDGLSGMVPDKEIGKIVSKQQTMRSQARVDALVELARQNGGKDNITAQIVEFSVTPKVAGVNVGNSGSGKPAWHSNKMVKIGLIALAVLAVVVIGVLVFKNCSNKPTDEEITVPADNTTTEQVVKEEVKTEENGKHVSTITLEAVPFKKDATIINMYFSPDGLTIKSADNKKQLYKTSSAFGTTLGEDVNILPSNDIVKYVVKDEKTKAFINFKKSIGETDNIVICFTNKEVELRVVIPIAKEGKPAAITTGTDSKEDGKASSKKKASKTPNPDPSTAKPVSKPESTPESTPAPTPTPEPKPESTPETPTPGTTTNVA